MVSNLSQLISQNRFEDDFEINHNYWWVGEDQNIVSKIENGKLTLDFKADNAFRVNWRELPINYEKDFQISAEFKQNSGIIDHGYGFVWGSSDISNLYYFIISSNGYASIFCKDNGNWQAIKKWTKFEGINEIGEINKLKMVQKNKKLQFYINDELFFDSTGYRPFGKYIGFIVNNTMEVEIDNLIIDYSEPKILVVDNPVKNTNRENLGLYINSKYSEITPIIAIDNNEIYFTRKDDPENLGGKGNDDIFYARRNKEGSWDKAIRLGAPLNNDGHNAVVSLSADGNSVLLMNQYSADGKTLKGGGLSKSYKTIDGWSIPQDVTIKKYYNKNKNFWENQFLSADNKILLMAMQRDDSYGDLDIYVCFLENGEYTEPKNLGPIVNTFSSDYSPFLAADGKTLYYTTSGYPGYGEDDIFMSKRLDDSWTNWSEPKNLGDGINTNKNDAYFVLPASGEYAYMTTTMNSNGGTDLISIKLNESAKPDPVVLVYGKVLDSKTNKPIGTDIIVNNLSNNKETAIAKSNPISGEYKIILPYGQLYAFLAESDNYYSISANMDLKSYSEYKEIEKNLYLTPIEKGTILRLNNVFFEYDKFDLSPESNAELDRLYNYLASNDNIKIEILGHTDNQGSNDYNMKLSNNRANSVRNYLIQKGISNNRLIAKGYGATKPIKDNATEEGRQFNRRVEVKILEN